MNKKSKYNLSDGEEDEFDNQNGLQGRDDFEDEVPFDEEDDVEDPDTESKFLVSAKNFEACDKNKKRILRSLFFVTILNQINGQH